MTRELADVDPLRLPKAAELVAARIRRQIVRRELEPGQNLPPESKLMEQFAISRPTLRESLRVLESEQLIEVHRGSRGGPRVRTPDPSSAAGAAGLLLQIHGVSLEDVLETELILECGAIRTLSTQSSKASVAQLRGMLAAEHDALDDLDRFSACAVRFHEGLIDATGNESLLLLSTMVRDIVQRHTRMVASRQPKSTAQRAPWRKKAHGVHQEVVDLIEAGDAVTAEDLWRRHAAASRRAMAAQTPAKDVLDLFE